MNKYLTRFWFESETGCGLGVTAYNIDDARKIIEEEKLIDQYNPNLTSYIENIDIQVLDQNHVIPNMGIVVDRGIWFPNVGTTPTRIRKISSS